MKRFLSVFAVGLAAAAAPQLASAQAFNGGSIGNIGIGVCTGNCGAIGPDGSVGASGLGAKHGYVSSAGGAVSATANGIGYGLGGETNGSRWNFSFTTTNPNTVLSFRFNYLSTDGTATYVEYGYAQLLKGTGGAPTGAGSVEAELFNARTTPTGNAVPGFGLPDIDANINPATTPILPGTTWSILGADSGLCFGGVGNGCGNTGWISMTYNIAVAGNYELELGVVNWGDQLLDGGMAFDFALGNGDTPVDPDVVVPEPSTFALMAMGLLGVGGMARRRRTQV